MMRDLHQFMGRDVDEAVVMWRNGFDTLDIARRLNMHESYVYSELPKWRAAIAKVRAA